MWKVLTPLRDFEKSLLILNRLRLCLHVVPIVFSGSFEIVQIVHRADSNVLKAISIHKRPHETPGICSQLKKKRYFTPDSLSGAVLFANVDAVGVQSMKGQTSCGGMTKNSPDITAKSD